METIAPPSKIPQCYLQLQVTIQSPPQPLLRARQFNPENPLKQLPDRGAWAKQMDLDMDLDNLYSNYDVNDFSDASVNIQCGLAERTGYAYLLSPCPLVL